MPQRLTTTQWLICAIAAIGFAFDIYELLMLPLIIKPAIAALSAPIVDELVRGGMPRPDAMALWVPGGPRYVEWARTLFFMPAIAGGVFGLLGGYLTDRLGRRRVLTFSILLYAFAACAAGFATTLPQLLLFRCLVFIGVCVEFVAAVAWLAELFPEHKQRERVLGYTQAFSSFGGLLVASANVMAAQLAASLPAIHGGHEAWRYTLISGIIPAIPLIVIRPLLPESPEWERKRKAGQLKRPSIAELFSPELARTTIITTLVFAGSYGIAFGAIQQLPQILGAPNRGPRRRARRVQARARSGRRRCAGRGQPAPPEPRLRQIAGNASDQAVARVSFWQEMGGLAGRFVLAMLAVAIVSRRTPAPHLPDPGADLRAAVVLVDRRIARRCVDAAVDQGRDFRRRIPHGRAVQFLGQLHPAGVSAPPARHRREFRGQHRRPRHRHGGGVAHHHAVGIAASRSGQDGRRRRDGGRCLRAGRHRADAVAAGAEGYARTKDRCSSHWLARSSSAS